MNYKLLFRLIFVIFFSFVNSGPVPKPQQMTVSPNIVYGLSADIRMTSNAPFCNTLESAFKRYYDIIFKKTIQTSIAQIQTKALISTLTVKIMSKCHETFTDKMWPTEKMDESYQLTVQSNGIYIQAKEIWGSLRGLETLAQLTYRNIAGTLLMNHTIISDKPRFAYRGMLIDTSRHFIPMEILKKNLEAMSMSKLNVFHWHIVDDQSFPYSSQLFPDLAKKGAYHGESHVYKQEDIADIMEFARRRGIRVVPEFDTPGHTESWGKAITYLLTKCYKNKRPDGSFGPINPISNETYQFLFEFMGEVQRIFVDNYLHLGGDEVDFKCWSSNPDILDFMKKMNFSNNFSKLEGYYMKRLIESVLQTKNLTKSTKLLTYQEVFDNGVKLPADTIIHIWKGGWQKEMKKVTNSGYPALLSSCWYLNYIHYADDWRPYYQCDPQEFDGTDQEKKLVIGGEACMWSEFVDSSNLMSRSWPRTSVVAERLWSDASVKDENEMFQRLQTLHCKMQRRDLAAEPINNIYHFNFCYNFL